MKAQPFSMEYEIAVKRKQRKERRENGNICKRAEKKNRATITSESYLSTVWP